MGQELPGEGRHSDRLLHPTAHPHCCILDRAAERVDRSRKRALRAGEGSPVGEVGIHTLLEVAATFGVSTPWMMIGLSSTDAAHLAMISTDVGARRRNDAGSCSAGRDQARNTSPGRPRLAAREATWNGERLRGLPPKHS